MERYRHPIFDEKVLKTTDKHHFFPSPHHLIDHSSKRQSESPLSVDSFKQFSKFLFESPHCFNHRFIQCDVGDHHPQKDPY
jgi:hypothetical protein